MRILPFLRCHPDQAPHDPAARIQRGPTPPEDALRLAPGGLERALARLPVTVQAVLHRSGVPGAAVAVVQGGRTVFARGFGLRDNRGTAPVTAETVFQIASLSKPVTATVVATQVAAERVSWDDPVRRHLPGLQLSDPQVAAQATIGDALEDLGYPRGAIIERLRLAPLDPFRRRYHYANFGFTIAAEAVAAAAGAAWEDLAARALFRPLGMQATSARHAELLARDNRALLHVLQDGRFQPLYDRDADAQSPAGGVSSTVLDLAAWMKLLLRPHRPGQPPLLTEAALLPALVPQVLDGLPPVAAARPAAYGYGFNIGVTPGGHPVMSHSGAFLLGAGTHVQLLPSADLGVVVLTNGGPVGAAEAIAATLTDTAQFGAPLRDWFAAFNGRMQGLYAPVGDLAGGPPPATPEPPRAAEAYAGRYDSDFFGPAEIVTADGKLAILLGPQRRPHPLAPWDGDVFALAPLGENAPKGSLSSVRFTMEEGGPQASSSLGWTRRDWRAGGGEAARHARLDRAAPRCGRRLSRGAAVDRILPRRAPWCCLRPWRPDERLRQGSGGAGHRHAAFFVPGNARQVAPLRLPWGGAGGRRLGGYVAVPRSAGLGGCAAVPGRRGGRLAAQRRRG
ncbi:hypothetical protein BKE38_05755, partial [Pseudoroseomonas deserti]